VFERGRRGIYCKIITAYKPLPSRLTPTAILIFPYPSLYAGEFNCQHVNWDYSTTFPHGEGLDSWAAANNLGLLHKPKGVASFFSHRWNVGTNQHNCTAWECKGCSRIPNAGKLAIIRAKTLNFWANYTATFTLN